MGVILSYKVELFNGNWYDEGYVFETRGEAKAYSAYRNHTPSRVVEATRESTMQAGVLANCAVNYQFKDGRLKPYKVQSKPSGMSWEEYLLAGGQGIPLAALSEATLELMLRGIAMYKMSPDRQIRVIRSSEIMLPIVQRSITK